MSLKTTNEEYGQYGLSLLGLAPRTKKLSVDDQAALSPTSIHTTDFSAGSSESQAPSFAEPPPPSEKSAEGSEDSETIRGTSCAKHIPGSYNPSALDDAIISDAELDGHKFEYHKISPALVPEGWSNDPKDLEPFDPKIPSDEYDLGKFPIPILASKGDEHACRYLFAVLGGFYLWVPASNELLYVTQSYELRGVLQRIHRDSFGLRTRLVESLSHWYSQHQTTHPLICSEDIPSGWSQRMKDIRKIDDLLIVHACGLQLPVLILASQCEFLMKCGDRYYIYHDVWCTLNRVEEPTELSQILRRLGHTHWEGYWEGMKLAECDRLPEYGGPYSLTDEDIPCGWSKQVDQGLCNTEVFDRHGISVQSLLLFHEADRGLPALYLVWAYSPLSFLIWDTVSNELSKIEQPSALHDILDALQGSSNGLTLSKIEPR